MREYNTIQMYTMLTDRQKKVLRFIEDYILTNGYPPTYREIASFMGINTPRGVQQHLKALEKKGVLKLIPGKARGIQIIKKPATFPLIGITSAGMPIDSEPIYDEMFTIDPKLAGQEEGFMVKVKGDSLVGIGIYDGDMVLISQKGYPTNGDIVLAKINGEITLKIFYKTKEKAVLKAANPSYRDIEIHEEDHFEIIGKATLVIRKLQ